MAADAGKRLEVDDVFSFADDLVGVLRGSEDGDDGASARMLQSACRSESDDLELQLRDCHEKIRSCKEKIDKAKVETIADDELNALQNKMDAKLQEEKQLRQDLRAVHDELDNLDRQSASIEERKDAIKKKEKDMRKAQNMLSICVSVTNIMPNLDDQDKVSGYIVDKNGKKIEKFEFEKKTSPVEICNKLWKKIQCSIEG
ncbi:kinetochore protein SPC24 homolog [Phragmites australis]|uniref:kinetochore protein SPC24 homolog n=1 Tax=Phragmites australis TaxID=29695 RepID=UPI002D7711AF|nr:kinetochore protein SPC24 homolog [Phragmites australis]